MVLFPIIRRLIQETMSGIGYGHNDGPHTAIMKTDGDQKQTQTEEIAELEILTLLA